MCVMFNRSCNNLVGSIWLPIQRLYNHNWKQENERKNKHKIVSKSYSSNLIKHKLTERNTIIDKINIDMHERCMCNLITQW